MNTYFLLFTECLFSLAASIVVLCALSAPLMNTLDRICPHEQAAGFWLRYTKILLVLFPLLLVFMVNTFTGFSDPLHELRFALLMSLAGLLFGVNAVGRRMGRVVGIQAPAGAVQ